MSEVTQLLFLDVETTGLKDGSFLLEVAATLTDLRGECHTPGGKAPLSFRSNVTHVPAAKWTEQEAVEMHLESGLFAASQKSVVEVQSVIESFSRFMDEVTWDECQLAGFGCDFDVRVLKSYRHGPLDARLDLLHRRRLNLSVVRDVLRNAGVPPLYLYIDQQGTRHRAADDVATAILYYKKLLQAFGDSFEVR